MLGSKVARFFFVSDLHGSSTVFNKVINAAEFYRIGTIVVGGDLTGKVLVPIVESASGYALEFQGELIRIRKNERQKLEALEKEIRATGAYYSIMDENEYNEVLKNPRLMDAKFVEAMKSSIDDFFQKAEERLGELGAKMYVIPGNDDYNEVAEYVAKKAGECVVPFDNKVVEVQGYSLLGYGYSNPTPWRTPREKEEKEIYSDLKKLVEKVDGEKAIYVIHAPPYKTEIDKAPKLGSDMRQSAYEFQHVGSVSVRRIIEEVPPSLGLHGHVHESGGIDFVEAKNKAKVPVINPGSEYSSGLLRGVIVELEGMSLSKYVFTKG
ncbi:MAG: metallophosphoesterase family protein [Candidatus Micrarchaeia archaeon]